MRTENPTSNVHVGFSVRILFFATLSVFYMSKCLCTFAPSIKDYEQINLFLIMLDLPKDPMMLFSVINMRLRDIYPSLDALCDDLHVDKKEIIDRLAAAGFEYNEQQNKFW